VSGVVPALIAGDDVETLGEQIDDLAFAFIAPLGAYDDYDFGHNSMPISNCRFVSCFLKREKLAIGNWQLAIENG
jgi:hypothetical protein